MKIKSLILAFSLFTTFCYSQIKKRDLRGIWVTENAGKIFSTTDTIKFYRNIESCSQKKWVFSRKEFKTVDFNFCSEAPTSKTVVAKEKIKLRKEDFGQVLEYYQNGSLKDQFRIIALTQKSNSELNLIRFDELKDEALYKYVDSLIVQVLKYNPNDGGKVDSIAKVFAQGNPNVIVKIEDEKYLNPAPILIVNGHLIENKELLKELLLVETYNIMYLTNIAALNFCGTQGRNGVIILQTSNNKFTTVHKNYKK